MRAASFSDNASAPLSASRSIVACSSLARVCSGLRVRVLLGALFFIGNGGNIPWSTWRVAARPRHCVLSSSANGIAGGFASVDDLNPEGRRRLAGSARAQTDGGKHGGRQTDEPSPGGH